MKQMLSSLLITVIGIYLVLCALLFLMQRQMLYLPQYTRVDAASTDFELDREGLKLRGWRVNPGQPRALLFFGGNAEEIGYQRERFARWFPGHTIYLLAYRGYGASEGSPSEAALKGDALALFDAIAQQYVGVDALGRSVGSGVALHVAARRSVGRLALITPYDSLVAVASRHYPFFPVGWLLRERFEASVDAAKVQVPTLLLLARQDEIIPPAHGEALARAFPQPPTLQWLDTDHNTTEMDANFALALQRHFRAAAADVSATD
jgi:pimeloyl-ACP methyl ester carboxylesterase